MRGSGIAPSPLHSRLVGEIYDSGASVSVNQIKYRKENQAYSGTHSIIIVNRVKINVSQNVIDNSNA